MIVRTQVINTRAELRKAGYVLAPNESAICILQADNAEDIHHGEFKQLCNQIHISLCKSSPYFHENMSSVERVHGMVFNIVRPPFLHLARGCRRI